MRFSAERKQIIKNYILEKISQKTSSVSNAAAEAFGVDPSTIHAYLNELAADHVIRRIKRGEYELVRQESVYELRRSEGGLDNDTYAFYACLKDHIKNFETNVQEIWSYTFSEMVNNVMDHSMAENARITVSQDFLTTRVIIYDNGIGIFRKLQEHFRFASVDEAVCELFKGKLTTDAENHSGEGIFFSSRLMDNFFIISSGKIFTINKYDDSTIADLVDRDQAGTYVVMELSNSSRKKAKEIFDAFADIDGAFVKTQIPMKNIFDSSPVSRSQAKRLCNRLEKFREVTVDFAEITWMGQGFAHQLFTVFADSHPEINIIPVNMNTDVARMYNHVRASDDPSSDKP